MHTCIECGRWWWLWKLVHSKNSKGGSNKWCLPNKGDDKAKSKNIWIIQSKVRAQSVLSNAYKTTQRYTLCSKKWFGIEWKSPAQIYTLYITRWREKNHVIKELNHGNSTVNTSFCTGDDIDTKVIHTFFRMNKRANQVITLEYHHKKRKIHNSSKVLR